MEENSTFENEKWLASLMGMENPMLCLLDLMRKDVANLGGSKKYKEVLEELDKAKKSVSRAMVLAADIFYDA